MGCYFKRNDIAYIDDYHIVFKNGLRIHKSKIKAVGKKLYVITNVDIVGANKDNATVSYSGVFHKPFSIEADRLKIEVIDELLDTK